MKSVKVGKEITRGEVAFPGKVWGKVRVFPGSPSPSQLDALQRGEIIVTGKLDPPHTRYLAELDKEGNILYAKGGTFPHFLLAVPKVLGIITDTGGRTSHGAFLGRDMFRVPTIVGTSPEDATKLLKTGDVVVLDADQGRVYEYLGGGEAIDENIAKWDTRYAKMGLRMTIRNILILKEMMLKGVEAPIVEE